MNKKNVAKSIVGRQNQIIRAKKVGYKEKIFEELKEIHKETFEFTLENNKIILTKRLKPQSNDGIVCLPEEIDVLGERSLAYQNDITRIIFPEHEIEIEKMACFDCVNLVNIICLNASKIGDFAFARKKKEELFTC